MIEIKAYQRFVDLINELNEEELKELINLLEEYLKKEK